MLRITSTQSSQDAKTINVNGLLRLRFIIVESSSSNFSVVQLRDNFGRLNAPINIELCRRLLQGLL